MDGDALVLERPAKLKDLLLAAALDKDFACPVAPEVGDGSPSVEVQARVALVARQRDLAGVGDLAHEHGDPSVCLGVDPDRNVQGDPECGGLVGVRFNFCVSSPRLGSSNAFFAGADSSQTLVFKRTGIAVCEFEGGVVGVVVP